MSQAAELDRVEYSDASAFRQLSEQEVADDLYTQYKTSSDVDGIRGIVVTATGKLDLLTRQQLLAPTQGSFINRLSYQISQKMLAHGVECWTSAKLVQSDTSGKFSVEITVRT